MCVTVKQLDQCYADPEPMKFVKGDDIIVKYFKNIKKIKHNTVFSIPLRLWEKGKTLKGLRRMEERKGGKFFKKRERKKARKREEWEAGTRRPEDKGQDKEPDGEAWGDPT